VRCPTYFKKEEEMNEQMAAEAILQDSSLTDELNDQAANLLIEWGVQVASDISKGAESDSEIDLLLQKLRDLMRRINMFVAKTNLHQEGNRLDELLNIVLDSWEIPVLSRIERQFPLDEILVCDSQEMLPILLSWFNLKEEKSV
jgi:hypothetical protein